eukprot:CAMPEP_0170599310 /NCGR_PEP_ID=MMETSP0224-20130122/16724_1 /TAXON_ID=285029 /ORGANISM="Togula jolla, Strain CCCM 725" /LENGTH=283 /DNA_ID=CAMNT_0010923943 /DNA_START=85 /DNA_END=936 /DNA_ORIENTATION=+
MTKWGLTLVELAWTSLLAMRATEASVVSLRPALVTEVADRSTYQFRLCNAYASDEPLEMRRLEEPRLVQYPLPYKECRDYPLPMKEGDRLAFRAGEQDVGTFSVHGLSSEGALMLLVPHRANSSSTSLTFLSHMFMPMESPQVAIMDVYDGDGVPSKLHVSEIHGTPSDDKDLNEHMSFRQKEDLNFNSVVALAPGSYRLTLANATNENAAGGRLADFGARAKEAYVAIRLGGAVMDVENPDSGRWPEELVVFPQVSGACSVGAGALGAVFLVMAHHFLVFLF